MVLGTTSKFFELVTSEQYERRFEYFNEMYNRFYQDVQLAHPVEPDRPWNLFSLDGGNIIVAAFNSCVANDCFSDSGYIRSKDIADCHLAMRSLVRSGCLPVAVWHHGVGGPPWASDYLDPNTVKLMIDKGFRLALHGHRHDSSVSPLDLFVSTRETLAVIGAGSLCAGEKALPHGVNHRYNVIQIHRQENMGWVHVREMNQPGIWGPGQLVETGGKAHVDFTWTTSSLEMPDQGRSGGYNTALVDDVERMINSGHAEEAVEVLLSDSIITDSYKRRLLGKALEIAEKWSDLKSLLHPPQNDEELAMFYMSSERSGDMDEVAEVLESSEASGEFNAQLIAELKQRFQRSEPPRRVKVVTTAIPYHVEINRIIELLAAQIYQSPLALLRENCQNAFDAVLERMWWDPQFENPEIRVEIAPGRIQVSDNGIGMSPVDLESHYWRAGSSGKNNPESKGGRSSGHFRNWSHG